jgi:PAS domain S-box-containing protein
VQVMRAGRVRALLGLGNKPSAYTDDDVADVTVLADLAWDIAARVRAEESLRIQQTRLDLAARSGKLGLWDLDLTTNVAWRTLQHDRLFGYDELQPSWGPEDALRHVFPEDRPVFQKAFEEAFATGHFHYQLRIHPRHQPLRWIEADGEVVRDASGKPVRMLGTVADVTERKVAELAALHVHEQVLGEKELLAALLASIGDEVWFADPQGRFALANPAGLSEFGMVAAGGLAVEEMARSLEVLRADGTQRPIEEAPPLRALRGEVVINHEEIVRTPATGELRHRLVTATPVKGRDGRSLGSVSVVRDVTEQRRREAALQASEEHFRKLVRHLPIPIAFNDPAGRIVTINERFTHLLGYTLDDIPTLDVWFPLAYPDEAYRREVVEHWGTAVRRAATTGGEVAAAEYRITTKTGTVRTMLIAGVPVGENLLVTFVDVTEARALQAQVALASRLAAMGTLVAGVAHEVNNPLAAEMANQGLALELSRELRDRLRGSNPIDRPAEVRLLGDVVDALEEAQESSQRIARIVKNLSTFGRPDPRRERVRLAEVVAEALRWAPAAATQGAEVRVEDGGAPDVVASIGHLEQVVVNLVTNAARAIPAGRRGLVVVRTGPGEPGMSRLEVVDDGTGIEPALLDRIFEPFFTTRPAGEGRGMGLGLAICHAIVTAHGGTLTVTSTPGKGSTFRVELPAAPPEE